MPPELQPTAATRHDLRIVGARIVTSGAVLDQASLRVENGVIRAVGDAAVAAEEIDFNGDLLIPGLIDLHTDNLERHYMPRAGAHWDAIGAAIAHDGQVAASGITTVFDSLSLQGYAEGLDRRQHLPAMIDGVDLARAQGLLRIDHLLHLRCEVSDPHLVGILEPLLDHQALRMLSVMDHTPGQGQYHDVQRLIEGWQADGKGATEIASMLERISDTREAEEALERRRAVAAIAGQREIAFASHDDRLVAEIALAAELGCSIAEFPVSLEAARASREHGLLNVMGAPNFVRGGSHSGNLSAQELAENGLLDAICSDYVPMSMLRALFMLTEAPFCWSLPAAVAQATLAPGRMAGLHDRGEIGIGLRADLLRIRHEPGRWPAVRGVWCAGVRVA